MIGFIIFVLIVYAVVGLFVAIFNQPEVASYHSDYEPQKYKALSLGIFWLVYLLRFLWRTVVRSFVILIKD
jgi:hypothetical protein